MDEKNFNNIEFQNSLIRKITAFLREIGLEIIFEPIEEETFVPGITIRNGKLFVDEAKLKYPGDLLHEAGHMAVVSSEKRKRLGANVGQKAYEEMMAIAWSFAALVYLDLEPSIVFHPDGYKGESQSLIENFTDGRYIAVSTLQWIGLTYEKKTAAKLGVAPFPNMIKWLAD